MKKYIDAEGVMRACYDSFLKTGNKAYREIFALLEAAPAEDVAEVVRCKDCKFWRQDRISCEGYAMCQTGECGIKFRRENDYCSVARRRTDE